MRRLFLLVILAFASTVVASASEKDLWTGSITYSGWTAANGDSIVVTGDAFVGVVEGYKIGLEYTVTPNSAWSAIEIWPYGGEANIATTGGLSSGDTSSKITLKASDIALLQEKGMRIGATGVTVTRVYLDGGSSERMPTVLWEGSKPYANWASEGGNLTVSSSKLGDAQAGDTILIEFSIDDASAYSVEIWNWAAGLTNHCLFNTSDATSPVSYIIEEGTLSYLQSDGFIMGGNNVTYKKISLEPTGSSAGITNQTVRPGSSAIYTIDGKKVTSPTCPGIYIKDGKKIIVRNADR